MRCPRCESSKLDERERDGILVDVCRSCRGVWLDRGELEKLIARATRDLDDVERHYRHDDTPSRGVRYHDDDDDDHRRHGRRKRSWFDSIGDIFD